MISISDAGSPVFLHALHGYQNKVNYEDHHHTIERNLREMTVKVIGVCRREMR